jgi:hypothetical protein
MPEPLVCRVCGDLCRPCPRSPSCCTGGHASGTSNRSRVPHDPDPIPVSEYRAQLTAQLADARRAAARATDRGPRQYVAALAIVSLEGELRRLPS